MKILGNISLKTYGLAILYTRRGIRRHDTSRGPGLLQGYRIERRNLETVTLKSLNTLLLQFGRVIREKSFGLESVLVGEVCNELKHNTDDIRYRLPRGIPVLFTYMNFLVITLNAHLESPSSRQASTGVRQIAPPTLINLGNHCDEIL